MPVSFSTSPITRATISGVIKRASRRKMSASDAAKEIVLRVDGAGWHPNTADPGAILSLAAAYVEGLRAVAKASDLGFTLKGVTIRDECVAIGIGVDRIAPAVEAATELDTALASPRVTLQGTSMIVDRIRGALQALPKEVSVSVKIGKRWRRQLDRDAGLASPEPVGELASLRARPIRVGGVAPAVRFSAEDEAVDFTLPCSEQLSRELGAHLYREVEIEASIVRGPDGHIEGGKLLSFVVVKTDDDPAEAWERWFKINGSGWDDDSVEAFVGRSKD